MDTTTFSRTMPFDEFATIGDLGLTRYGGHLDLNDFSRAWRGTERARTIHEMSQGTAIIGAILHSFEMFLRRAPWSIAAADEHSGEAQEVAEFVDQALHDQEIAFDEFIAEAASFLPWGFAPFEILYKRRGGDNPGNPAAHSAYSDGRIGWRRFAIRAQDTLWQWAYDAEGNLVGMQQRIPFNTTPRAGQIVTIPIQKMLLFKTTSQRGSPEGFSILRRAYTAWFYMRSLEKVEAIGIERNVAGYPVIRAPYAVFVAPDPTALNQFKAMATEARQDERMGIVLPSDLWPGSNVPMYDFKLASSGMTTVPDIGPIIRRYATDIAMSVLFDFALFGHNQHGTQALGDVKMRMFVAGMDAWLHAIAQELTQSAVLPLLRLNGIDPGLCPVLTPGSVEKRDLQEFGTFLYDLGQVGLLDPDDQKFRQFVFETADLPAPPAPTPEELAMKQLEDQERMAMYKLRAQAAQGQPGEGGVPVVGYPVPSTADGPPDQAVKQYAEEAAA